jgi:hypothetical protein
VEINPDPALQQRTSRVLMPDRQTVETIAGYRVGYLPPRHNALSPGLLYVEIEPPGGRAPRIWIGTIPEQGFASNMVLLSSLTPSPGYSILTIDDIANPSSNDAVSISGTASSGCEMEFAALIGEDPDYMEQVTDWSPWDARSGTFAFVWWLPPGDNYRIRGRILDDPTFFVDSNLFAAVAP